MNTINEHSFHKERILTFVEAKTITKKEYQTLKEISRAILKYIKEEIKSNTKLCGLISYFFEQTIRNTQHPNVSVLEKEIIIANILLPDDYKVADVLNNNGFTIDHLKIAIRFRSLLKNNILSKLETDQELKKQFTIYDKFVKRLTEIFRLNFGIDDQDIILNRICELVILHPEYFDFRISIPTRKK